MSELPSNLPTWVTLLVALAGVASTVMQRAFGLRQMDAESDKLRKEIQIAYLGEARQLQQAMREQNEKFIARLCAQYEEAMAANQALQVRVREQEERIAQLEQSLDEQARRWEEERQAWQRERKALERRLADAMEELADIRHSLGPLARGASGN